jgi:molecular chaperone DnaK (HSP70)
MSIIYRGASKLVISIDVGATSSAVAWQHLQVDTVIQPPTNVAQWSGAHSDHDYKVPTSILYKGDQAIKFGQEAEDEEGLEGTFLIRNPKLALHPKWLQDLASAPLPPLIPGGEAISTFDKPTIPSHLTIEKIYKDFLSYLIEHTRKSFIQSHLGGAAIFDELVQSAHWILGAPNT